MKKVIVFDMDGVLIDSMAVMMEYTRQRFPGITDIEILEISAGNYHAETARLRNSYPRIEQTEEEKELARQQYAKEKHHKSFAFPGIVGLVQKLHSLDYMLFINTNAFERNGAAILEKVGIQDLFKEVLYAELSKSKVDKFKYIFAKYQVQAKNIIFITDTLGDILEAGEVDISTVAVTWGAHDHGFFNRHESSNLVAIVDTVSELEQEIINFIQK